MNKMSKKILAMTLSFLMLLFLLPAAAAEDSRGTFDGRIVWNSYDVQYKGSTPFVIANGYEQTPRFTVRDARGRIVDPSNYSYYYSENIEPGTGYLFVTFNNLYSGTVRESFKIYLPSAKTLTVSNGYYCIDLKWMPVDGAAGYVIYRRAWSSTTDGWTEFERWDNTTETEWSDCKVYAGTRYQYGVKAYFARRYDPVIDKWIGGNVGDNYNLGVVSPLKTVVYITPRTMRSLSPASGKITAYWFASKVFTGYQVQYATDQAFTKNVKSVQISSAKTTETTIKSLTNKKTYYVRVRSYHNFEGVKYYGPWSDSLYVKLGSGWCNVRSTVDDWDDGQWYYVRSTGKYATGWRTIDKEKYYFMEDGMMAQGLCKIDNVLYFFMEHPYGHGPSEGGKPDSGTLSHGGFESFSDGSMLYCNTAGRVLAYDGQGSTIDEEGVIQNYFEYAYQAFNLVWDFDTYSMSRTVKDIGFFDIDGDGRLELYILWKFSGYDAYYEFYRANFGTGNYDDIGSLDGAVGKLKIENNKLMYVYGSNTYRVAIRSGSIVLL